jgi:NAD(P)-dependent dehydrogenase (short-subunit alcohol dehydrogenase family)
MTDRRVALITLASGYVGPPLARLLAASGHDLVLHVPAGDRSTMVTRPENSELVDELTALGASVEVVSGVDLATKEGNLAVVDAALQRFGRLDAACFVTGQIITGRFLESTIDQWERVKSANLDMVYHALQAALPPMVAAGRGQIVVFTSATGARPEPMVSLYSSTRAGANALVRAVGLEHAKSGVTVNAIGTNYMDFEGFRAATGANDPERRKVIEGQVPMRRLGTMEELAEFTAVLLDGRSRFQTGQFFSYSGGWST